jgi:hypothetical protein
MIKKTKKKDRKEKKIHESCNACPYHLEGGSGFLNFFYQRRTRLLQAHFSSTLVQKSMSLVYDNSKSQS